MTLDKSHTLSGPLTFHISQRLIRSSQDWWEKPSPPPPPRTRPLTWWTTPSISTGMMKSALFTGYGGKERLELRPGLPRPPSQARQAPPNQGWGPRGRPTLKELCTRVSSRSMTTQILSESWALASGSRYWTGVCCGDERGWLGAPLSPLSFLHTSLPACSPQAGKSQGQGRGHPLPRFAPASSGARVGRLALWASLPHLGNPGREQRPPTTGTFKFPWRSSRSCQVTSWVDLPGPAGCSRKTLSRNPRRG